MTSAEVGKLDTPSRIKLRAMLHRVEQHFSARCRHLVLVDFGQIQKFMNELMQAIGRKHITTYGKTYPRICPGKHFNPVFPGRTLHRQLQHLVQSLCRKRLCKVAERSRADRGYHVRGRTSVRNNDQTGMRPYEPDLSKKISIFRACTALVGDNKVESGFFHLRECFLVVPRALQLP